MDFLIVKLKAAYYFTFPKCEKKKIINPILFPNHHLFLFHLMTNDKVFSYLSLL